MKKLLYIIFCTALFTSCKKDYSCTCTSTMKYEIKSATKSGAEAECDSHDNICPAGVVCVTSWDCELD